MNNLDYTTFIRYYFDHWHNTTNVRSVTMAVTYNNLFVLSEAINKLKQLIGRKNVAYISQLTCLLVNGRRLIKKWYNIMVHHSSYKSQMVLLQQGGIYADTNAIYRALQKWIHYRKEINIMNENINLSQIVIKILISNKTKKWLFNRFKKYHRIVVVNSLHRDFMEMASLHYMMLRYVNVFRHFRQVLTVVMIQRRCKAVLNCRVRSKKCNSLHAPVLSYTIRHWKFKVRRNKWCRHSFYSLRNTKWEKTIMKYLGVWCVAYMRRKSLNEKIKKIIFKANFNTMRRTIYCLQQVYFIILSEKNHQKQLLIQAEESYLAKLSHVRLKNEVALKKNFLLKWKILVQTRCITRYFIHAMKNTIGLNMVRRSFNTWKVLYDVETIVICVQKNWRLYKVKWMTHAFHHQYMVHFKKNIGIIMKFRRKIQKRMLFGLLRHNLSDKHVLYQLQHNKIRVKIIFHNLGRYCIASRGRRASLLLATISMNQYNKWKLVHHWIKFVHSRRGNHKLLLKYDNRHRKYQYCLFLSFLRYYTFRNNRHSLIQIRMKHFLLSRSIWRLRSNCYRKYKSLLSSACVYHRRRKLKALRHWYQLLRGRKYESNHARILVKMKYLAMAFRILRKFKIIKHRNRSKLRYQLKHALQSRKYYAFLTLYRRTRASISCKKKLKYVLVSRGRHTLSKDVHGMQVQPVSRIKLSRILRNLVNKTRTIKRDRRMIKYIVSNRCRHSFNNLLRHCIQRCLRKMERRKVLKEINGYRMKRAWMQCMNYFYFKRLKSRLICIHRLKCRIVKFLKHEKLISSNRVKLVTKTNHVIRTIKCRKILRLMRQWNNKTKCCRVQRQIYKVVARTNRWHGKRCALLAWRRNIRSRTHRILNLQRKFCLKVTLLSWLQSALLSVKRRRSLEHFQYEKMKNFMHIIFRGWKSYSLTCKRIGLCSLQVFSNNNRRIKNKYLSNWVSHKFFSCTRLSLPSIIHALPSIIHALLSIIRHPLTSINHTSSTHFHQSYVIHSLRYSFLKITILHSAKVCRQIDTIQRRSVFYAEKKCFCHWKNRWSAAEQSKMYDGLKSIHKHFNLWIEYNLQTRRLSLLVARFQNWKVTLEVTKWRRSTRERLEHKEHESYCIMHYNKSVCRKLLTMWRDVFFRINR